MADKRLFTLLQSIISKLAPLAKDSGWIYPTLNSAFANYSTTANKVRYRKIGSLVEVEGEAKPTATITGGTTQNTIFTLPSGYRPANRKTFLCQGSSTAIWECIVNIDGTVIFSRYQKGGAYVDATTSVWLPFHITYFVN